MLTKSDKQFLKEHFATKDDLKAMERRFDAKFATKDDLKPLASKADLAETKESIIKEITDFLHEKIILILEQHERRLDRLEKTVGGFPPIASS